MIRHFVMIGYGSSFIYYLYTLLYLRFNEIQRFGYVLNEVRVWHIASVICFLLTIKKRNIMAIEFSINGLFDMTIYNYHTETEVEQDIEQGILDNLQQGEYIISIDRKLIFDINDLQKPLYKFSLDATDTVDYEFDEL